MLQVSSHAPEEPLAKHFDQGQALLEQASLIGDISDYESWKTARKQWIELTAETLGHIYDGSDEADKFKTAASAPGGGGAWQTEYEHDSECLQAAIDILISLQDPLEPEQEPGDAADAEQEPADAAEPEQEPAAAAEAEPEPAGGAELEQEPSVGSELAPAPSVGSELAPAPSSDAEYVRSANGSSSSLPVKTSAGSSPDRMGQVLLVHGRNEKWKQTVAGLLERAGSNEVTILNERPNDRRKLVERFEEQAGGSHYAIVMLTADDVGGPRLDSDREPYFSPRACQGVVFEMGVLVAALTPHCVCVLYEDGVELPCDLDGIVYVRLDPAGTWQSKLLLQLRGAGFDYDMNRLAPT
jgi:predicted nucleotide-binding protein